MPPEAILIALAVVALLVVAAGTALLVARFYVRVPAGKALLVRRPGGGESVSFVGAVVVPFAGVAEVVDCTVHRIVVERLGKQSLRCRDGIRVDVVAEFHVGVNRTTEDVLRAALTAGAARAGDPAALSERFHGKFVEALASVLAHVDLPDLGRERQRIRDEVINVIGMDLDGWKLADAAIVSLDQVPLEAYDPEDVLDAEAILRIRERTLSANLRANELALEERRHAALLATQAEELKQALEARKS
jgi:uncharacterized membrane protein YqiK